MKAGTIVAIALIVGVTLSALILFRPHNEGGEGGHSVEGELRAVAVASSDIIYIRDGKADSVTFSARASNGSIVEYLWDLGDGTKATGVEVTHQYPNVGEYRVKLTVKDSYGRTDTDTIYVVVNSLTTTSGTLYISQSQVYTIPVERGARSIKAVLTYPSGQVILDSPQNSILLTVRSVNGNVSYDSSDQGPSDGDTQKRIVVVPGQSIAAVNYSNFEAEVKCQSSAIDGVSYNLEMYVTYGG